MYLSNIKKIELEALGIAIFAHFLALLLYGIVIIKPEVPHFVGKTVKVNLGNISDVAVVPATLNQNKITNLAEENAKENAKAARAPSDYLQILQSMVRQRSRTPAEATEKNITGNAVLRIEFNRDGKILKYTLKQGTGNKILDDAALETGALISKKQFPPVPDNFYPGEKILKFDFGINY